jgi:hypothetical protein
MNESDALLPVQADARYLLAQQLDAHALLALETVACVLPYDLPYGLWSAAPVTIVRLVV